jgi:hypothetical protein
VLVAAAVFDPGTGLAVFPLPAVAPVIKTGKVRTGMLSSDFQEAKNIETVGPSIMPNTRTGGAALHVVTGAAVDWLLPGVGACEPARETLTVAASAPGGVSSVRFSIDGKHSRPAHKVELGIWAATVSLPRGRHSVVATAVGAEHKTAREARAVRVCSG